MLALLLLCFCVCIFIIVFVDKRRKRGMERYVIVERPERNNLFPFFGVKRNVRKGKNREGAGGIMGNRNSTNPSHPNPNTNNHHNQI